MVLKVLAALGTGFDCSSEKHIQTVLSLGVEPHRIIFGNPAKQPTHIRYASDNGVLMTVFDSEYKLDKMKNLFPGAKLVVRIKCDASSNPVYSGKVRKFGCHPKTEAPRLLKLARDWNLDVVGISFHVGSGCRDISIFKKQIASAKNVLDFARSLGDGFNLLNIGGGFPGHHDDLLEKVSWLFLCHFSFHFSDENTSRT